MNIDKNDNRGHNAAKKPGEVGFQPIKKAEAAPKDLGSVSAEKQMFKRAVDAIHGWNAAVAFDDVGPEDFDAIHSVAIDIRNAGGPFAEKASVALDQYEKGLAWANRNDKDVPVDDEQVVIDVVEEWVQDSAPRLLDKDDAESNFRKFLESVEKRDATVVPTDNWEEVTAEELAETEVCLREQDDTAYLRSILDGDPAEREGITKILDGDPIEGHDPSDHIAVVEFDQEPIVLSNDQRRELIMRIGGNLAAISGGRVTPLKDGIEMPVSYGYKVRVRAMLEAENGEHLYSVERVFARGGKEWSYGKRDFVPPGLVSQWSYYASCYNNDSGKEWTYMGQ